MPHRSFRASKFESLSKTVDYFFDLIFHGIDVDSCVNLMYDI
jgi:hypothetical protein